jgi:hypothetical protein
MDFSFEMVLGIIKPVLEAFTGQLGGVGLQIVVIIGSLRLFLKPLQALGQVFVDITPSSKDNEMFAKIVEGKVYKIIAYVFDWMGSIKLPK